MAKNMWTHLYDHHTLLLFLIKLCKQSLYAVKCRFSFTGTQSELHKDMICQVSSETYWMVCSKPWPQPHWAALGWTGAQTVHRGLPAWHQCLTSPTLGHLQPCFKIFSLRREKVIITAKEGNTSRMLFKKHMSARHHPCHQSASYPFLDHLW